MPKYEYEVMEQRIVPPLRGGQSFAAKPIILEVIGERKRKEVLTLPERWGQTAVEARSKAEADANDWIAEHEQGGG